MCGAVLLLAGCPSDSATDSESESSAGIESVSGSATDGMTDGETAPTGGMTTANTMGATTEMESDTDPGTDTDDSDATTADDDSDTQGSETTAGEEAELLFLEVTPGNTILELDLNETASQDFIVTANYTDGSQIDVTNQATFELDNPAIGALAGPTLNVPAFANTFFDSGIVTATVDGSQGKAQVTIAAYRITGDQQDFFFVLPFNDPAGNQDKPLTFNTDVKAMDVFISMDTTASMSGEIANLRNALATTIIPDIQMAVPNTRFGAGTFRDFPISGYGSAGDQPFTLFQPITNNVANVQAAVNSMTHGGGNDIPESGVEALYQIATGQGLAGPGATTVAANNNGIGGVEFREGSFPVVVSITDATSHDAADNTCSQEQYTDASVAAVAHTEGEAMDALNAICARVVQIATAGSAECTALGDGVKFATQTGAIVPPEAWDVGGRPAGCAAGQCCTGTNGAGVAADANGMCPMAYLASGNGSGVDTSFSSAIQLLAAYGQFDVSSETNGVATDVDGVALPMGNTTADFIKAVTPFSHGVVPLPGVPDPTITPTQFLDVIPDTDVTFTIEAYNDFIMQGTEPRLFTATIRILADDCGDLDEREVFILVPPEDLPEPG